MFGQQRSQSGPTLSINTGVANSFGSSNNASQPQSGGLFGSKPGGLFGASSTATPSAASAGTLFGTSTTTQSGSLFGTTTTAPSQAGTLFGGSAMNNASSAPLGGGLFGGATTSQAPTFPFPSIGASQPQTTSIFASQTSSQPQNTGLFGNPLTSQPQQVGGLFGSSTNQAQPGTGLFGATNTAQQQQQQTAPFGTSLLGSSQQNQQQQQQNNTFGNASQRPSLFGGSQNTQQVPFQQSRISTLNPPQQTQLPAFSASIGQYTTAQQTVPGVLIDISNLKPTTRFSDLYGTLQKEIENIDAFILKQMELQSECESAMPSVGEKIIQMPQDVELCARKLDALERALETDAAAIESARELVKSEADDARLSFKAIHSLRIPAQFHASPWNAQGVSAPTSLTAEDDKAASADLVSYFSNQADEMGRKLDGLTRNLREVESYLGSLEAHQSAQVQAARLSQGRDGGVRSAEEQIRELAGVLREFEGGILSVAGKVGAAREGVQEVMLGDSFGRRGRS